MESGKRRFGDRSDGRRVRTLAPLYKVSPFIMKTRTEAQNYFSESLELEEVEKFIRKKREEGLKGLGILHIFIGAYVRAVSQRPGINRFIAGQRIFARNGIEVVMMVKKEMSIYGTETSIKIKLDPRDTIDEIYEKVNAEIDNIKNRKADNGTDKLAAALDRIPGLILSLAISVIRTMDYFGILPRMIIDASPFHGSMFVTDLGSLGIRPIYHHLYDIGNIPVFLAFGMKRRVTVLKRDGTAEEKKVVDYTLVTDERICDGFYYASAFRLMKDYFRKPELLDSPPKAVTEDIM